MKQNSLSFLKSENKQTGCRTDNLDFFITSVANDISDALTNYVEELDIVDYAFRKAMLSVMNKAISSSVNSSKKCSIFYDVVPGFTLICFKKDLLIEEINEKIKSAIETVDKVEKKKSSNKATKIKEEDLELVKQNMAEKMVANVVDVFFQKSGKTVITAENSKIFLLFFPVSNIQANLIKLGFYHV